MKSRPYFLLTAGLLLVALGCQLISPANFNLSGQIVKGSGVVVSEPRPVSGFTRVELTGIGDMEVVFGDQEALTITAEDNLLPLITSEVRGNTLVIGLVEGIAPVPSLPIRFDLTALALEGVSISGLSNVHLPATSTDRFSADLPGAGSLVLDNLQANTLEAQLPGLGSFEVHGGTVQMAEIDISGAGNFEAPDLQVAQAEVQISGLGSATLGVSESLEANISGAGSVKYYGNPSVSENVSGLGEVEKLGD